MITNLFSASPTDQSHRKKQNGQCNKSTKVTQPPGSIGDHPAKEDLVSVVKSVAEGFEVGLVGGFDSLDGELVANAEHRPRRGPVDPHQRKVSREVVTSGATAATGCLDRARAVARPRVVADGHQRRLKHLPQLLPAAEEGQAKEVVQVRVEHTAVAIATASSLRLEIPPCRLEAQ